MANMSMAYKKHASNEVCFLWQGYKVKTFCLKLVTNLFPCDA